MEFKVHFVVAAFGQDVDNFTLHIYASIAQQERKMIGERISAAHLIAKKRGMKFGLELRSKTDRRRVAALGRACKGPTSARTSSGISYVHRVGATATRYQRSTYLVLGRRT